MKSGNALFIEKSVLYYREKGEWLNSPFSLCVDADATMKSRLLSSFSASVRWFRHWTPCPIFLPFPLSRCVDSFAILISLGNGFLIVGHLLFLMLPKLLHDPLSKVVP